LQFRYPILRRFVNNRYFSAQVRILTMAERYSISSKIRSWLKRRLR
jgi:hypothetical protein